MVSREGWSTAAVPVRPPIDEHDRTPGLVLVYCENHEAMLPAYRLRNEPTTLGREADNSIAIHDHSASRYHARIEKRGQSWQLVDLGSTNGTFVDGKRVVNEAALTNNAILRVGDTLFKFIEAGVIPYQAYRIDGSRHQHLSPVQRKSQGGALVGGYILDKVCASIEEVATSFLSVVVTGESGTGKELVAREIHRLSGRPGAFQAINCAAIPDTLIESELFGYKRGAFTGAQADKIGLFKAADGGTLFLDEIGDMPPEVQVKLLRTIQFREVQPLGAAQSVSVDVRVVCATHRNLREEASVGTFRGDLFARLDEYEIMLPPLRERKEDVYLLTKHFMTKYGRENAVIPFAVMLALVHYDWPYNVRELESAVKRLTALAGQGELEYSHLPDPIRADLRDYGQQQAGATSGPTEQPQAASAPPQRTAPTLDELVELLTRHQGNISAIGRELGKERVQIHRWLKRHGLNADDYRNR